MSAGVGLPSASMPTEAGMSFTSIARGWEPSLTPGSETARRRGVANALARPPASSISRFARPRAIASANASPRRFSALGGSSSQKSSTSSVALMPRAARA
jgi:hypothetical protein